MPLQIEALRAYAAMMNTLDAGRIESLLADDFVYESQMVLEALTSKQAFLDYIRPKLATLKRVNAQVHAEMGWVDAQGSRQPCVVLAQHSPDNLVALVLATVDARRIRRLDLCVVPSPQSAERSGEYPR